MKKYLVWMALVMLGGMAVSCQSSPEKKPAQHEEQHDAHKEHKSPCRRS